MGDSPSCCETAPIHPSALIRKLQSWAWVKNFLIIWVGFLSQFLISYGFLRRILAMHTQVVSVSQHAGWFGAPCCRSTLPDQFFPRIFHDFQRISADFPWISMGFPWIFDGCPWILKDFRGFSMEFPWISADFPLISIDFPRISNGFPRILHIFPRISHWYSMDFRGFSMDFHGFSKEFRVGHSPSWVKISSPKHV